MGQNLLARKPDTLSLTWTNSRRGEELSVRRGVIWRTIRHNEALSRGSSHPPGTDQSS
jgi:hypothetical protein